MSPNTPSPPALIELFDALAASVPDANRRLMFGYPSFVLNGNMFAGLFRQTAVLRLSPADIAEITDPAGPVGAVPFEPMPGRPMTGFVELPESAALDADLLAEWVGRAYAHAQTMPAKIPKPKKPKG